MPREFHLVWVRVAAEEAYHFTLLREHLESLGYAYRDFDAHDGLWSLEPAAPRGWACFS